MPVETVSSKEKDASRKQLSGLDELERTPVTETRWGRFGSRLWANTWPKVLASRSKKSSPTDLTT